MLARRLLILLAVLMGLTALASGVAPRQQAPPSGGGASPPATAADSLPPIEASVDAGAAEPTRIVVDEGRTLVLEVRAAELDSVSLEGLDRIEAVDPDSPARFELLAEPPGSYPIQLVEAARELGTIEIRAAG